MTAMSEPARPALRKVLVVDDDEDIGVVAKLALSLDGTVAVEVCTDGESALMQLGRFKPDVVLLDVMMPRLDGPATLTRMRRDAALAHTPVVFLTAKALPSEIERLLALGAIAVMSKPFAPMTLLSRLREIWQGASSLAPPPPPPPPPPAAAVVPAVPVVPVVPAVPVVPTAPTAPVALPGSRLSQRLARDAAEFSELAEALEGASSAERQLEILQTIDRLAHKLQGAAATFGAAEVAGAVADLRAVLRSALAGAGLETERPLASLRALIATLKTVRC